tara:strand:+ start:552 stop:797 length:246 start_codon:yes stop_codon:yes gene_type:complete
MYLNKEWLNEPSMHNVTGSLEEFLIKLKIESRMNILLLIYFVRHDGSKIYLNSNCVITIRNKVIKLLSSFATNRLGALRVA